MSRLPSPGGDNGTWGVILNDFLSVAHATDGTLGANVVTNGNITDGTITSAKLATAVQTSLGKADTALQAVTKTDVGLGNVDNTSDATKNSATATLTNKSLSDSTTFFIDDLDATKKAQFQLSGITTGTTRTITMPNSSGTMYVTGGTDVSVADGGTGRSTSTTAYGVIAAGTTATGAQQTIAPGTAGQVLKSNGASALGSFQTLTSSDVGLGNVNNTSDANKPISTATQTALDAKLATANVDSTVAGLIGTSSSTATAIDAKISAASSGSTAMYILAPSDPDPTAGSPAGLYFRRVT